MRRANKLQRLVINISLPIEGVVSVNDISEHCDEEFSLAFPRTKYDSNLYEVVFDTFAFEFSCISWSPQTSKPLERNTQHFPDPECPVFSTEITALSSTSKLNKPTSSNFTTPHSSAVPHITLIFSITPPTIPLGNPVVPPRMARFDPLILPTSLHDLPQGYGQRIK